MKKILFTFLPACFCLLVLLGNSTSLPAAVKLKVREAGGVQELACEVSTPSEVRVVDGWIEASLVIRNVSEKPIRICTLSSGSRHIWKGNYKQVFNPGWWKSNRPKPESFADQIVTLNPDDTFTFPIKIHYDAEFFRGQPLTISSGYSTDEGFAKQYDTWSGSIEAKPVTVRVVD